jgi:hypothetical protein
VRHTANGGNTQLGAFRNDSDSSNARVLEGARWVTGNSAAGAALLYFDNLNDLVGLANS